MGHNIERFDCLRIREAFAQIGQPAPEPLATIDSLTWLRQRFGKRAGDMKVWTSYLFSFESCFPKETRAYLKCKFPLFFVAVGYSGKPLRPWSAEAPVCLFFSSEIHISFVVPRVFGHNALSLFKVCVNKKKFI